MIRITTAVLAASILPSAFAEDEPHADVLLMRNSAGQLVTGAVDFGDNTVISSNLRVYEGEFDAFGTTSDPGFNALSSSNPNMPAGFQAIQGDTVVSFDANAFGINGVTANLFYWDAVGANVSFGASTDALTISKAPSDMFTATLDGSGVGVLGFDIETTDADGFLHKHIDFSVDPAAATGIYLWSLTVHAGDLSTQPLYFVHALGDIDEAQHEAAAEFVETVLVPAPGTVVLAALGFVGVTTRRRRTAS